MIEAIEANPGDPVMPWHRGGSGSTPQNVRTGQDYQGVNILNLWAAGQSVGYAASIWGTYRQWQNVGAQVRKGEKSVPIVFYKQVNRTSEEDEGEVLRILKYSSVFNADQVDGWEVPSQVSSDPPPRLAAVEKIVEATGARIIEGGDSAFYRPLTDTIHMPDSRQFFATADGSRSENFSAVLLHELIHWTGHPTRCNRDLRKRFGSEAYAMEELVAELGAAFLCARLSISLEPRDDHARYLANWLKVLKEDKKAIFTAAAKAHEAADYVL